MRIASPFSGPVYGLVLLWGPVPVGSNGDGGSGTPPPPNWIVIPGLIVGIALIGFVHWSIWSAQRPFTRRVTTSRGPTVVRGAPEDVERTGDLFWKSIIRTRPGWGRPWIVTVSGPAAEDFPDTPERFATRRAAQLRADEIVRDLRDR